MKPKGIPGNTLLNFSNFISHRGLYLILASAAFAFINSLNNNFVWDDWVLMVPNEVYRTFDIKRIFLSKANSLEYLPFRDLTLAVDYRLWGMNPFGYHLSNLLFYMASLVALYKMVKLLVDLTGVRKGELIPFWATLIFALHPLHVEPVNFIGCRNTLLSGLFVFMSFNFCIAGIQKRKNVLILISALFFLISLFSKATVVFYPLFLAVVLFIIPGAGCSLRKKAFLLLVFFTLDLAAIWVHLKIASSESVISAHLMKYGIHDTTAIIAKALQIPFFYLKKLLLPYPLSIKYPDSFMEGGLVLFLALGAVYALIIFYSIRAWKRGSILPVTSVIWYFLSLGPVLNIFPTYPVVADRYAYFAVLSLGLLIACLLKEIISRRKIFIYAAFAVVTVWSSIDILKNMDWRSDISLWKSALAVDPNISKRELAIALWNEERYEEALTYFKEEADKTGSYEYSLYKGRHLFLSGQFDDAINFYQRASNEGAAALKETHLYIAQAYEKKESDILAMKNYLRVFDTKSQDPLGEYEKSAEEGLNRLRKKFVPKLDALRGEALSNPVNLQAQMNAALFLYELGMYVEAEDYYLKSLNLLPSRWDLWYQLGVIYMKLNRHDKAVNAFEQALTLKPDDTNVLRNIGISYMAVQDYNQAAKYFKLALKHDPGFLYAAFNLGKIYLITGNRKEAKEYLLKARSLADENNTLVISIDELLKKVY